MPFKYDAQGNIVTADHNGKKLPVFINAKGEESPFDADGTVESISRLNGEAQSHRERAEKAEKSLKGFDGITDPVKALAALNTVSKLDAKQLVDAGEIDRVRADIAASYDTKIKTLETTNSSLTDKLYGLQVGGAFTRSKFIADKVAIPVEFMQARFQEHFGIENDEIFAVDAQGNKLYSRVNLGKLADVDEALEILVSASPQRDAILKGAGGNGGGAQNGGGGGSGGKQTMTRKAFEAIADPVARAKAVTEVQIVD